MEKDYLQMLAQVVLPAEILEYFSIRGIEQSATEIHISLDEKMKELCCMEKDYLQMLAQVVLPAEILEYFSIRGIEQSATEIHISLDEKMMI